MEHTEQATAVITSNEPGDGAKLVIDKGDGDWTVIWRDDKAADRWYDGDARGQHWFEDHDEDPMALHEHLKYADAVYALGQPLAVFA